MFKNTFKKTHSPAGEAAFRAASARSSAGIFADYQAKQHKRRPTSLIYFERFLRLLWLIGLEQERRQVSENELNLASFVEFSLIKWMQLIVLVVKLKGRKWLNPHLYF